MSLSLWVASYLFNGLKFDNRSSLLISALVLGFFNAVLRPVLFFLTLPITLVTLGFFALALNAFMIMLVAKLVTGFKLSGFWTAFSLVFYRNIQLFYRAFSTPAKALPSCIAPIPFLCKRRLWTPLTI